MEPDATSTDGETPTEATTTGSTRRKLLRTAVNVAVGGGLVWGVGTEYVSTNDTVRIVYAMARSSNGTLEARTRQVPRDWYRSLRTAFDVQQRLGGMDLTSILGSFVVPGSYDQPTASVSVDATAEDVREEVVDVVDAVPVDVEVVADFPSGPDESAQPETPFQVEDIDDPDVPGGVYCRATEKGGTLAPALYDARSGDRYFATSNHLFDGRGSLVTEHEGETLSLQRGDETRVIGRVERGYPQADVVQVAPTRGRVPTSDIARASPSTVLGQYTREGLADLMARDEVLHKFGSTSGHTTGSIHGVDGVTCYTGDVCRVGQIRWGSGETMADGDSGSVSYHADPENPDEYVLVGGINNARSWWPGADFSWGTAAHELLSTFGLHF